MAPYFWNLLEGETPPPFATALDVTLQAKSNTFYKENILFKIKIFGSWFKLSSSLLFQFKITQNGLSTSQPCFEKMVLKVSSSRAKMPKSLYKMHVVNGIIKMG